MAIIPMKRFLFIYKVDGSILGESTVDHFDAAHAWEIVKAQIARRQQIAVEGVYITDVTCSEEEIE